MTFPTTVGRQYKIYRRLYSGSYENLSGIINGTGSTVTYIVWEFCDDSEYYSYVLAELGNKVESISGLPGVVCVNQTYIVTANLSNDGTLGSGNTLNWGGATIVSQNGLNATVIFPATGSKTLESWNDAQSPKETEPTKSVDLLRVEIVSGATAIADGSSTPADTDVAAAIKQSGKLRLKAVFNPTVTEAELSPNSITWTGGGTAVSGKQLEWEVSRTAWIKRTITASICNDSASMIVSIIGAEESWYSPQNGTSGLHMTDNSAGFSSTGLEAVGATTGSTESRCEIRFRIKSNILYSDGVANLFDVNDILWDVSRDKKVVDWRSTNGQWVKFDDRGGTWASDDSHDTEEDNNPWDRNGYLFGNDNPGFIIESFRDGLVKKLNMREWIRVSLGGSTTGRNGTRCSDYYEWKAFRSLSKNGTWANSSNYDGNTIILGNQFWGSTPLPYP